MNNSLLIVITLLLLNSYILVAVPNGVSGRTSSGCGGSGCHTAQSNNTSLQVNNIPSSINAASQVSLIIDVINSSKSAAGFDLVITDGGGTKVGTLSAGTGSKILSNELVHSSAKAMSGGKASFDFKWTAPSSAGTYYIKAVGNAVDGNGKETNDEWAIMSPIPITVTAPAYNIKGLITENGVGLSGVNVSIGSKSASSDANGNYSITNVSSGTYTVTPSKNGYTFSPQSQSVTIANSDANANFTATGSTYSISGKILYNSQGLSAVKVSYGNNQSVQTDANGNYNIAGISKGTSLTLTPSKSAYDFSPISKQVVVNSNLTNQDFIATLQSVNISGKITLNGIGLEGVSIDWGIGKTPVITSSDGTYRILNVSPNTYTLTPSLSGFEFSPSTLKVVVDKSSVANQNFTATQVLASIEGNVSEENIPMANVLITYKSNLGSKSVRTNDFGKYKISGLEKGEYVINASYAGYSFSPNPLIVKIQGNETITEQNFNASKNSQPLSIKGKVIYNGMGISDVVIKYANGKLVHTKADGSFEIKDLQASNYTLIPNKVKMLFIPESLELNLQQSTEDIEFEAFLAVLDKVKDLKPANNSQDLQNEQKLTWGKVENADSYQIQLYSEDVTLDIDTILKVNEYTLENLGIAKSYFWKVRALNSKSKRSGLWSEEFNFQSTGISPEKIVDIFEPQNNTENVNPQKAIFKWKATQFATHYELIIAKDFNFLIEKQIFDKIATNEIELQLEENTNYYWQIRAISGTKAGEWSLINSFKTGSGTSVEYNKSLTNRFNINVFPNPTKEILNLNLSNYSHSNIELILCDIFGRKLYQNIYSDLNESMFFAEINLTGFTEGIYYLRLKIGNDEVITPIYKTN